MDDIIANATAENALVGERINGILESHGKKAIDLLDRSKSLATLTSKGAKDLRSGFVAILADAKAEVAQNAGELSLETRCAMAHRYNAGLKEWRTMASELYTTFGVDLAILKESEGLLSERTDCGPFEKEVKNL